MIAYPLAGTVVFIAMLGFGYYLQEVQGLTPCPMCIVQRYCYVVIAALALEQKTLYNILFWDCDPVKYQQVLSLLPARRPRVHAAYQLRYAQCCAVLHQFDQMEQLLAGLPPMKSGITKLACLNMGMNHAFTLRDAAGLGALRQSLDMLCRENAGKWLFEKNAAPVRMLLAISGFWLMAPALST